MPDWAVDLAKALFAYVYGRAADPRNALERNVLREMVAFVTEAPDGARALATLAQAWREDNAPV